jgi:hypothetical protein
MLSASSENRRQLLPGPALRDRPLPFDSAQPNLRMNRAAARFTNSKATSTAKSRRYDGNGGMHELGGSGIEWVGGR